MNSPLEIPYGPNDYDEEVGPVHQPIIRKSVANRLARTFLSDRFTHDDFVAEVRAVSQAAAVSGNFEVALKGYEMLAPSVGVRTRQDAPSQHLHLHNVRSEDDAHELTPDEIKAQLAQIEAMEVSNDDIPEDW